MAAAGTPYSQAYRRLLARTGRLEAVKRGHTWVTTRAAYRASVGLGVGTDTATGVGRGMREFFCGEKTGEKRGRVWNNRE